MTVHLIDQNVKIIINTRNPIEHEGDYVWQVQEAVMKLQDMGIAVLYTAKHHRKLAIIDRYVTYEGILNILLFSDSFMVNLPTSALNSSLYPAQFLVHQFFA